MLMPHVAVAYADSTSWKTLVHVQGTSGFVTGVGVAGGPYSHEVAIALDGAVLAGDVLAATGGGANANNGIGLILPFARELEVEIRDDPTPSPVARFWAAYLTAPARPRQSTARVADVDGRPVVYEDATYVADDGHEFTTTTARTAAQVARVQLARDALVAFEPPPDAPGEGERAIELSGEVRFELFEGAAATPQWPVELDMRPAGRTWPVASVRASDRTDDRAFFGGAVRVPAPGDYEVVTRLPGYANVPASFLVL